MKSCNAVRVKLGRLTDFREFMLLWVIIIACVVMTTVSPVFLTKANIMATLLGLSTESIVAIGMTILLISKGFDLSVGSTAALTGAMTALCLVKGVPTVPSIIVGLAIGSTIGITNGLIVAKIGINPLITTLGMMSIVRGILLIISRGMNIAGLPAGFKVIGQGKLFGIQYPILICITLVVIFDILLRKSKFLRQSYYIGGNENAAVLCGIRVNRIKIFNYALTGLLAAAAGIIMTSRLGASSVTAGTGLELRVITAVVIGGASLAGGEGTILGAFLGSLLMAIIVNALTLLGVDVYWNTFIIGATLLIAVLFDTLNKKWKESSRIG